MKASRFATIVLSVALGALGSAAGCAPAASCPDCVPAVASPAFVVTSDYVVGGYAVIDSETWAAQSSTGIDNDPAVRAFGSRILVLGRTGGSVTVFRFDAGRLTLERQFSVADAGGPSPNPHDVALVAPGGAKAYVTRFGQATLAIVDVDQGTVTGTIDLSAFADADGRPEMDGIAVAGGRAYVACELLDAMSQPTGPGVVAVIDVATDSVVDLDPTMPGLQGIALDGANPYGSVQVGSSPTELLVATVGVFGAQDGGIERIDLTAGVSLGFLVTEAELGGDVGDFAVLDATHAAAVVSDASFVTHLVTFDPSTGLRTGALVDSAAFDLSGIGLDPRGNLWVADRAFSAPGVRVFDLRAATERTAAPIGVGLPPIDFAFLP